MLERCRKLKLGGDKFLKEFHQRSKDIHKVIPKPNINDLFPKQKLRTKRFKSKESKNLKCIDETHFKADQTKWYENRSKDNAK
jgi:hypothetical protein